MAFKNSLARRLSNIFRTTNPSLACCRVSSHSAASQSAALTHPKPPHKLAPDPGDDRIFRRYLHLLSAAISPELRFIPTGEKLLEKLRTMDVARDRIRLDALRQAAAPEGGLTVKDAVKILKVSQLEMVVKAIQGILLPAPSALPHNLDDPRMKELQEMEREKAAIDTEANLRVRRELWCGLGYLIIQTAALMRLTFWELTWDVMEPICFYLTSIYFMGGYAFFLRTSKEPSFEGFFQSRFSKKQKRLMKAQNFDVERYNELKKACHPHSPAPGPQESAGSFASPVIRY